MDYQKTASEILDKVGGEENIVSVGHCATRLRFVLRDESKADDKAIKHMPGILSVVHGGGQYQVVIGGEVTDVYREISKLGKFGSLKVEEKEQTATKKKENWFNHLLSVIAGIFFPYIMALTGCGLLKALLSLLVFLKVLDPSSTTYVLINTLGDTAFYFLPVLLAVSAAKKFQCNEYLAGVLGAFLIHPNVVNLFAAAKEAGTAVTIFGLPVTIATYSSTVIPAILTIFVMSYVQRFAEKISPKNLRMILVPVITLLIMAPLELVILAPLGNILAGWLSFLIRGINSVAPWLVTTLVGAFTPLLVMMGMHYAIIPLGIAELAESGYDTVAGPGMLVSNIAQGGASLGAAVRSKDKTFRSLASSVGVTAVMGITEPAMYGISLRYKRPLYAAMISGAVSGFFLGIFHVGRYAQAAPGLLALTTYIGGDSLRVFYLACIGSAMAFVIAFIISFLTWNDSLLEEDGESAEE